MRVESDFTDPFALNRVHRSYRTLRDGSLFAQIPGNKLPGCLHFVPTGQAPNELLPVGRRFRLWYRGVMPSEYKNQGVDHRDYGLHDRQGPEVPGF